MDRPSHGPRARRTHSIGASVYSAEPRVARPQLTDSQFHHVVLEMAAPSRP
jgi:hypothetical protein